jgi:tRNA uridine 5-carboxymethylaminomethyl modification enzyme
MWARRWGFAPSPANAFEGLHAACGGIVLTNEPATSGGFGGVGRNCDRVPTLAVMRREQNMREFQVIVIGGGHAGVEAAWAAANVLGMGERGASVALVTIDPSKIGVMSCNPAIGGLAKGQLVREVDAMGGLMGLATDRTGIQFKVLNTSKGPAVHGPRAQCDKHAYADAVQALIAARGEIDVIGGTVDELVVEGDVGSRRICGVKITSRQDGSPVMLRAPAVVLTTGTFMRGLMHTGEQKTSGGRFGEAAATGISAALKELGFELGRLKTGTPPRLKRGTIRWEELPPQYGDVPPVAFSELSGADFPVLPQVECRQTYTTAAVNAVIRENLHRAPMYSGQIESAGPRYCPSIEDKVVRFAERDQHGVFLEPESLRDDWIYCNGISTSLPADVQDVIVRSMPGCERAEIYRYGYAVEYDMVRPHQIYATGMTKSVEGLFLAGQINGTSGYEEAAAQGLVAGINAARRASGLGEFVLGREEAYIGVLMDDLITKTPVEPYRMFTSRAEHRLLLRSDNAADRLTPRAVGLGLLARTEMGRTRVARFETRRAVLARLGAAISSATHQGQAVTKLLKQPDFEIADLKAAVLAWAEAHGTAEQVAGASEFEWTTAYADRTYESYIARQQGEIKRQAALEHRAIPPDFDYATCENLRKEARTALGRFRPATFGQAGRLEGVTPADLTLLAVLVKRWV